MDVQDDPDKITYSRRSVFHALILAANLPETGSSVRFDHRQFSEYNTGGLVSSRSWGGKSHFFEKVPGFY